MTNRDEAREEIVLILRDTLTVQTGTDDGVTVRFIDGIDEATDFIIAILSPEEVGGSDQPHPSVATGQPEQGALLSGWQPIATAPQPWDWMSTHCARFLLARLYQPTDEDGEVAGPAELVWSHVAYMTASGWMLPLQGVTGLHGYGSLPLSGATHWMRLPDDGSGHGTESTTDASRAPGTPNNPSNQTKGGE